MKNALILFISFLIASAVFAADKYAKPRATINEDTIKIITQEDDEGCKQFKLTKADVVEFFKVARIADEDEYREPFGYPCFIEGAATLHNGKKVKWFIKADRYGIIELNPPENEPGQFIYYYCNDCSSKVYNEDCDAECKINRIAEQEHMEQKQDNECSGNATKQ